MPPGENSRHLFTFATTRGVDDERLFLSDRQPFLFTNLPDTRVHTVRQGDTLPNLASKYFAPMADLPKFSPASLWWVIADFQPNPIHDPTIQLVPGQKLFIPSVRTVQERVLQDPDDE